MSNDNESKPLLGKISHGAPISAVAVIPSSRGNQPHKSDQAEDDQDLSRPGEGGKKTTTTTHPYFQASIVLG